jgi:hypothetical protein
MSCQHLLQAPAIFVANRRRVRYGAHVGGRTRSMKYMLVNKSNYYAQFVANIGAVHMPFNLYKECNGIK